MIIFLFLLVLLVIALILHAIKIRKSRIYKQMSKVPKISCERPIVGIVHLLLRNAEGLMDVITKLGNEISEIGGTARLWGLGYFYVGLTDPKDIAKILKQFLEKDDLYKFLRVVSGNGSVFGLVSAWKNRRKVLVPIFNTRMMEKSVNIYYDNSVILSNMLEPFVGAGTFSILPFISSYSFYSISGITFGDNKNARDDEDIFFKALNRSFEHVSERITHFWMHPDFVYNLLPQNVDVHKNVEILQKCVDEAISKRRLQLQEKKIEDKNSTHIVDFLLNSNLRDEEIREECIVILGAMDTSTITLGFMIKLLALYPLVQDKIYEELCNIFDGSDRPIVKEDLIKLNYLDRVIKETLRLYPPVPVILRKILEDVTLPSSYEIPSGAGAAIFIYGLHRNPKYWGPDAEHFDPDRFLPERFETMDPCAYLPFSTGPRNCLGYKYGVVSIKICLSTILRKYKFVGKPADGPIPDIKTKFGIFISPADGFYISLEKRKS